jgi:ADP-ribose pyrophosphatase YjhB (NUDIX family)
MNKEPNKLLDWSRELQALSTAGRFYTKDAFDAERFDRILEIAAEMAAETATDTFGEIRERFSKESIYQTPKIDSRAVIFNEQDEVLLVEELDHTWAPPGGWCEYDLTPAANAVKEAREEAGADVEVLRLVAVHDQHQHNEPFAFFSVERFFYLCRLKGGEFQDNIETLQSGWFSLDNLPYLHPRKSSEAELRLCLEASRAEHWETRYDL